MRKLINSLKYNNPNDVCQRLQQELEDWFQTPLGQRILADEMRVLHHLLPEFFGYYLVHLGPAFLTPLDEFSSIKRCYHLISDNTEQHDMVWPRIHASPKSLPFKHQSVDLLILQHSLDTHMDAHQILREVERVLVPGGGIILIGFNPWSLWGIGRLLFGRRKARTEMPWGCRFLSPYRVTDWLQLLNFEVASPQTLFQLPPHVDYRWQPQQQTSTERTGWKSWSSKVLNQIGGVYILSAKKSVSTYTPLKPRWSLMTEHFAKPKMRPLASPHPSSTASGGIHSVLIKKQDTKLS